MVFTNAKDKRSRRHTHLSVRAPQQVKDYCTPWPPIEAVCVEKKKDRYGTPRKRSATKRVRKKVQNTYANIKPVFTTPASGHAHAGSSSTMTPVKQPQRPATGSRRPCRGHPKTRRVSFVAAPTIGCPLFGSLAASLRALATNRQRPRNR